MKIPTKRELSSSAQRVRIGGQMACQTPSTESSSRLLLRLLIFLLSLPTHLTKFVNVLQYNYHPMSLVLDKLNF